MKMKWPAFFWYESSDYDGKQNEGRFLRPSAKEMFLAIMNDAKSSQHISVFFLVDIFLISWYEYKWWV